LKSGNLYKVLFHIDSFDVNLLNIACNNAANLITDKGVANVQVALVANYMAPKLFLKNILSQEMADKLALLTKTSNTFIYICHNSMKNLGIDQEELVPICKVVPSGITKIVELQSNGFAYIKP